jgi:hypothetical protein
VRSPVANSLYLKPGLQYTNYVKHIGMAVGDRDTYRQSTSVWAAPRYLAKAEMG